MPNPLHDPGLDPEYTEDTGLGGRGLERVSHGPFLAIRNFFENQDEIRLIRNRDRSMVHILINELKAWNEESLGFTFNDWNDWTYHRYDSGEADIRDNIKSEHNIHTMNLGKDSFKWTAMVNCSSRNDIQGGELIFQNWKDHPRVDNYGKVHGNKDGQPQWINELGTVIFFPSIEPWGYKLVVSGGAKRVIYNFRGGTYK